MEAGKAEELVAVWWHDCRVVLAMTTMYSTSVTTVMKQPKGCHEKRFLSYPTMLDDYNMYMDGVDLTDQHLSYYSMTTRKALKWWKKGFERFVDICIVNCASKNNLSWHIKSQRVFQVKLIEELVEPLLNLRASSNCPTYLEGTLDFRTFATQLLFKAKPHTRIHGFCVYLAHPPP